MAKMPKMPPKGGVPKGSMGKPMKSGGKSKKGC